MFSWFRSQPQCPVDPAAKKWVEARLHWLSREFGRDTFTRRAMILPTADFFPDPLDNSIQSVRNLLDRVGKYMDADLSLVRLELYTNPGDPGLVEEFTTTYVGFYEESPGKTVIYLETSQLLTPLHLVATMAHELAHLRLMGEGRLTDEEFDNELLTDLTAVFYGFGIFLANTPRGWDINDQTWPGTQLRRPEYMTLPMFAYALAHAAWHRNDPKPEWARLLNPSLRACFRQGVSYLFETGDSQFAPQFVQR